MLPLREMYDTLIKPPYGANQASAGLFRRLHRTAVTNYPCLKTTNTWASNSGQMIT